MEPTFNNKVIINIRTTDGNKEISNRVLPSLYASRDEFIDCFSEFILNSLSEAYRNEADHSISVNVPTLYFDPLKERHESDCLSLTTKYQRLYEDLGRVYDFLEPYEKRMTASYSEQISAELEASSEQDRKEIEEQADAILELLEEEKQDEIDVSVEAEQAKTYSEAYMLGETDERIAKANADELEDAREQTDPNTHLAHPTSSGTEEPLRTITYSDEMTVEDTPAPATDKLEEVTRAVVVVCATLSLFFLTVILGVEAFHQVMSLF